MPQGRRKRAGAEADGLTGPAHQIDPQSARAQRHGGRNATREGGQHEGAGQDDKEDSVTNKRGRNETESENTSSNSDDDSSEEERDPTGKHKKQDEKETQGPKEKKAKKEKKTDAKEKAKRLPSLEEMKQALLANPEIAASLFKDEAVKVIFMTYLSVFMTYA